MRVGLLTWTGGGPKDSNPKSYFFTINSVQNFKTLAQPLPEEKFVVGVVGV